MIEIRIDKDKGYVGVVVKFGELLFIFFDVYEDFCFS